MNEPKISIIVPVYKVENYLHRCLDSIENQTFKDWECILVDDGSPDKCPQICDEYAEKDSRFRVIHQKNAGVSAARLNGFNVSKGDFISFVDSDDYLTEDALLVMKDCLEENDVEVVITEVFRIPEGASPEVVKYVDYGYGYMAEADIKKMKSEYLLDETKNGLDRLLALWGKLYRREVLENILKKSLGMWWSEDIYCILHIIDKVKSIYVLDRPTYYNVSRPGSATHEDPMKRWQGDENLWRLIEDYDVDGVFCKQMSPRVWWSLKRFHISAARCYGIRKFAKNAKVVANSKFAKKYVWDNIEMCRERFTMNDYINYVHIKLRMWLPYWLLLRFRDFFINR